MRGGNQVLSRIAPSSVFRTILLVANRRRDRRQWPDLVGEIQGRLTGTAFPPELLDQLLPLLSLSFCDRLEVIAGSDDVRRQEEQQIHLRFFLCRIAEQMSQQRDISEDRGLLHRLDDAVLHDSAEHYGPM